MNVWYASLKPKLNLNGLHFKPWINLGLQTNDFLLFNVFSCLVRKIPFVTRVRIVKAIVYSN